MKKHALAYLLASALSVAQYLPKLTSRQLEWYQVKTADLMRFTVVAFVGKDWGDGTKSPKIFSSKEFDT
jgi:alpha-L-fucosidase